MFPINSSWFCGHWVRDYDIGHVNAGCMPFKLCPLFCFVCGMFNFLAVLTLLYIILPEQGSMIDIVQCKKQHSICLVYTLYGINLSHLDSASHCLFSCCCFCRFVQPRCQRGGWYPSSTDGEDCSTSYPSTCCAGYRWANPAESVESAAAGAASAHAQTGTVQGRNGCTGQRGHLRNDLLILFVGLLLFDL